jgi:hypothetical protein
MTSTLSRTDLHRTFLAMERHGGHFCARLAGAWYAADPGNKQRIEAAFPHLLEDFGPNSAYFRLQNQ